MTFASAKSLRDRKKKKKKKKRRSSSTTSGGGGGGGPAGPTSDPNSTMSAADAEDALLMEVDLELFKYFLGLDPRTVHRHVWVCCAVLCCGMEWGGV